jgi:hypothetical protein
MTEMKTQFRYEADMPDFWRLVDSINWAKRDSADIVKKDLMKQLSPTAAQKYHRILYDMAQHLCSKFIEYAADNKEKYNAADAYFAACNVVGGGKSNYYEFDKEIKYLASELENLNMDCCFAHAIPTEDDYFYAD